MPIYAYAYTNKQGYPMTDEIGAQDILEATEEVRRRLGKRLEFVLWDRDNPPKAVLEWREKWLEE